MYQNFNQAKESIHGIEAIDYFFAKEMLSALVFERMQALQQQKEAPQIAGHSPELLSQLNHIF